MNPPGISLIPHLQCNKSVPWSETKFPLTGTMDPMTGSPRLMLLAKFMGLGRRIYTHSVYFTELKLLPLMRHKNSMYPFGTW